MAVVFGSDFKAVHKAGIPKKMKLKISSPKSTNVSVDPIHFCILICWGDNQHRRWRDDDWCAAVVKAHLQFDFQIQHDERRRASIRELEDAIVQAFQ